ncbi:multidrug effflux MFS transporter [Mycobacterium barrassiae]|uniref:multidrug effflux MFS transporter n=1 Tax=Mycobacterium barrassiae TaxID=319709 RepID=UPI002265EE68|nr:multidrug effflux MFS transporter [Mycobacterium barrassiae]
MTMSIERPQEVAARIVGDRRLLILLLLVIPLSQIGLDVYAPALPQMAADFGASDAMVQNTVTAYTLGMSVAFIPVGLLADALGRRWVLLTGTALVALTSIGCALAGSLPFLLGMRFIQGVAAGTCLLMAAVIAADCFRGAKLVSVLGVLGAAWGTAPVVAPAIGGFVVQHGSWRLVFALFAFAVVVVTALVAKGMPETLDKEKRSPVNLRAAMRVLGEALRHKVFIGFVLMFGLIGAAQMVFGVAGPFLFEEALGFSPAAYGLIALVIGAANLVGELACGGLAQRITTRKLALSAWTVMILGALTLVVSARTIGVNGWIITLGAALVLGGVGVLDPQSKGLAMGVFSKNIGLIGGLLNTCCYLIVSLAMALIAHLPETTHEPLGWFYVSAGMAFVTILLLTLRSQANRAASC